MKYTDTTASSVRPLASTTKAMRICTASDNVIFGTDPREDCHYVPLEGFDWIAPNRQRETCSHCYDVV
jgi:hypothetical protein